MLNKANGGMANGAGGSSSSSSAAAYATPAHRAGGNNARDSLGSGNSVNDRMNGLSIAEQTRNRTGGEPGTAWTVGF